MQRPDVRDRCGSVAPAQTTVDLSLLLVREAGAAPLPCLIGTGAARRGCAIRLRGGRDAMERPLRLLLALLGQVAESNDPDESLAMVDHRDPADLPSAHDLDDLVHIVVVEAPFHVVGHDLADAVLIGRDAGGRRAHGNIAVGHHADQPAPVADRQDADIDLVHEPRGIPDRAVRLNHANIAGHHIGDFHERAPSRAWLDAQHRPSAAGHQQSVNAATGERFGLGRRAREAKRRRLPDGTRARSNARWRRSRYRGWRRSRP